MFLFQVILGGGQQIFTDKVAPCNYTYPICQRSDGTDLIEKWKENKKNAGLSHAFVDTAEQLENINTQETDSIFGMITNYFC